MPRKRNAPARKKGVSTKAADPTPAVLQPIPANTLKRPLNNDLSDKTPEPEAKRTSSSSTRKESSESKLDVAGATQSASFVQTPLPSWNGTGQYNVTSGSCYGPPSKLTAEKSVDVTGFSMKVFYCRQSLPHQLYATFCFDKLDGIMRLCPKKEFSKDNIQQFEKKCYLKEELVPGPENPEWAMRWRGTDGGMQLNKLMGDETINLGGFDFEEDPSSTTADFVGVNIFLFMFYNGQLFSFNASKVGELDSREIHTKAQTLEQRWKQLQNPVFKSKLGSELDSDSNSGPRRATVKRVPKNFQQGTQRQTMFPDPIVGLSSRSLDVSASSRGSSVNQPSKTLPKGVPEIDRCGPGLWKDHPGKTVIENPSSWAWNLTGHWKITAPTLFQTLDLEQRDTMTMDIHLSNFPLHTRVGRQLWADFNFGDKITGLMRFCPASTGVEGCSLKQFDEACKLPAGQWAGPSSSGGHEKWLWRWRGKGLTSYQEGSDEFQDEVEFGKNKNGGFTMQAVFTYQHQKIFLKAVKDKEPSPPKGNPVTILTAWDGCKGKARPPPRQLTYLPSGI